MFSSLPQETQDEFARLAQHYGQPLVRSADLGINNYFDPLNKSDRYGEVCMVIRRKNGRLLTMIKTFYPRGAHRLPTGGINYGESIYDALLRETYEETGLQVEVRRFLAAVAYLTNNTGDTPSFYTFAFLLDEIGGTLGVLDEGERIEEFLEIEPEKLPGIADYLQHLGDTYNEELGGNIHHWGIFRAVIHRVVWEALKA